MARSPAQAGGRAATATRSTAAPQILDEPKPPFAEQHRQSPGLESQLLPRPHYAAERYKAAGKLADKVALVTGGDSGIGRAVAVLYAREGAKVAIAYLPGEERDARETTAAAIEAAGSECLQLPGNLEDDDCCDDLVARTTERFGRLDIVVSNAAYQRRQKSIADVTDEEFDRTFRTNVYAYFRLVRAALPHLRPGAAIIATGSETGIMGSKALPDYSASKGAIHAFTKTLAQELLPRGIRVNAVAPGPVWTPLNPTDAGLKADAVAQFGADSPMQRPAQPEEVAPAYVYLASDADSSYTTGIVLQVMGGETTGG
jgi:NAD(P)-dependent dehydrogenase (short-subunit alcohol dehydrogenase family)